MAETEEGKQRRRRYQNGSLQKRKCGKSWVWVAFWWAEGSRRGKTLGKCTDMTKGEALAAMATQLQPVNVEAQKPVERRWTIKELIEEAYLPFCRRKWKESTASTTEDRIEFHIVKDLGKIEIRHVTREMLQRYLEKKGANKLSYSVVAHLRWDLRAIFRLAHQDGLIDLSPAESLFVSVEHTASRKVLTGEQVRQMLEVLDLREQLVVRLAIHCGMRPGEIIGLKWKHAHDDYVEVEQRVYRGKIDTPKTARSRRQAALSPDTKIAFQQWKEKNPKNDPEAWVFPSEKLTTPIGRDNLWRRVIEPKLKEIKLDWATFQVMRRTHASLSRKAGIDPKLVADQLGHGIGVNLDTYTLSDLGQRLEAVNALEQSLGSTAIN